jgi:sortase A
MRCAERMPALADRTALAGWGASSEAPQPAARRLRIGGTVLMVIGFAALAWVVLVWRWQDPFTLAWMRYQQHGLAESYEKRERAFAARDESLARTAGRYQADLRIGDPVGRLLVPRLGLDLVVVYGTGEDVLRKGPGLDPRTHAPGEKRLSYVAGHRTTFGAPFSDIDELRSGDRISWRLPYATVVYAVSRRRIVDDEQLGVLKSRGREELVLQACWPRFFASQRILVYAKPVAMRPA